MGNTSTIGRLACATALGAVLLAGCEGGGGGEVDAGDGSPMDTSVDAGNDSGQDGGGDGGATDCLDCLDDPEDMKCTQNGNVAWNPCAAKYCWASEPASAGDCGDSADCLTAGGDCTYTLTTDAACPDGARWDLFDTALGCANGNYQATCCFPFGGDCTFHGGSSMGIDADPFTCEAASVCISGVQQDACAYDADISDGFGGAAWNADVTITALPGSALKITGVHHDTGATFTCEGQAADDFGLEPTIWECEACDAASVCTTCSVTHTGLCQI
ncbi:MAG: hypothetical protein PHU25_12205 [Deltaproteobacteria bacterium]|nr:hypothetical protein [Deltaproteobacteria bacterium]